MPIQITALYLAIFAVFALFLGFLAGKTRGSLGISIGDGGRPELLLAMRRQANFVENVPMIMIMFAVLELNGAPALLLHGLGIGLLAARVLHAANIGVDNVQSVPRGIGAGGTLLVTVISAGYLMYQFVTRAG